MQKKRGVVLHQTWDLAFPRWDAISNSVPVSGRAPVAACSPETRTEVVLEAATAYRNLSRYTFSELYPFAPSTLDIDLGRKHGVQPFSTIAEEAVTAFSSRTDERLRVHRTLAQTNISAAAVGTDKWRADEVLREVTSALFGLSPEDFYLVVDVQIRGRDRKGADAYYFDNFGQEVDEVLPHALAHAGTVTQSSKLSIWLSDLCACPELWRVTHPQLSEPLGILEFTLAQALEALYPDLRIDWTLISGERS